MIDTKLICKALECYNIYLEHPVCNLCKVSLLSSDREDLIWKEIKEQKIHDPYSIVDKIEEL